MQELAVVSAFAHHEPHEANTRRWRRGCGQRTLSSPAAAAAAANMLRHHTCAGSGHNITLPSRAFDIPAALEPLLAQLTPERQRELKANPRNLTADELERARRR